MRKMNNVLHSVFVLALLGCGEPSVEDSRMVSVSEVLDVAEQYNLAWESLNADNISNFHTDDFHYYWRGVKQSSTRQEYHKVMEEEILPTMSKWSMTITDISAKPLGKDAAVVSYVVDTEVILADGTPYNYGSGALSYVLERADGGWKVALVHESSLESKE